MTATEKRQCSVKIWGGMYGGEPCRKPATIERDGKWYCRIHDPEYIKAKRLKLEDKWEKILAELDEHDARIKARETATEGLSTEELKALTPALLRAAILMRDALEAIVAEAPVPKGGYAIGVVDIATQALRQAKEGEK